MSKKKKKRVSVREIREILRLRFENKMGHREISRSIGVSRSTVSDYLAKFKACGLSYPLPMELDDTKLEQILFPAVPGIFVRTLPNWNEIDHELKRKSVTLQLLWGEYRERVGANGYQYSHFCNCYRTWKKKIDVCMRQTHVAGEKFFTDYAGQTVGVVDPKTGEIKQAQIFVGVLGASNYTYCEATWDQALPNWIGSHVRAFEFFGGVPKAVVPDNLKSGVRKANRYEPEVNYTYAEMAKYYGTAILPARPYKPKDKAKAEVGVQIVERWILAALRNQTFFSLEALNDTIGQLLENLNWRPFKKLKGSRHELFETIERQALRPLPPTRYSMAEWKTARVNIDYHVELDRHYYSVPYQLNREVVQIRYTSATIEIFFKSKRVASHMRSYQKGRHTTIKEHMPKSHQAHLDWSPTRLINWAKKVGPSTATVVEKILKSKVHPEQGYRSCLGILRQSKKYGQDRLENACKRAVHISAFSYQSVSSILDKGLDKKPIKNKDQIDMGFDHSNIRGEGYYH